MHLFKNNLYYIALIIALISTLWSLYFSAILHWIPCDLCWYQRIMLYPMVLLIPVGILRKDKNLADYILPLSSVGAVIALYHFLLLKGIFSQSLAPCTNGVSCLTKFPGWYGEVTIPLLSFLAFLSIAVCMVLAKKYKTV